MSEHQSKLQPRDNKFHRGNGEDGRHYWLTPPDIYAALDAEFHFDFDPCPYPLPLDFDGLTCEWGRSNYVNPPFGSIIHEGKKKGPTAWVRKAIAEQAKGRRVVLVYPVDKWVLMLLSALGTQVRNLGDVRWLSIEDGLPGKGTGRHIAAFILEPKIVDFPVALPPIKVHTRDTITQRKTHTMRLKLDLDIGTSPDPVALQQMFTWASKLDISGAVSEAEVSAAVAISEIVQPAAVPIPGINGAAEPAAAAPAAKRKPGRPPGVSKQPQAAPEPAPATVLPGAPLPGAPVATLQPQPQPVAPAMPQLQPAPNGAAATLEDLRSCIQQANQRSPQIAHRVMKSPNWSDGTPKPGNAKWFTAESVPVDCYDRVIEEIMAAAAS